MKRLKTNIARISIAAALLAVGVTVWRAAQADTNPRQMPIEQFRHGVVGGPHDFTGLDDRFADACRACHVPHMQSVRAVGLPGSEVGVELYRMPGQRRTFAPTDYTPGPTSLVCIGCHDGTVATSTIGSSHALLAGVREGFVLPDGFSLTDHPIGIPYPKNRNDEYRTPANVTASGRIQLPEGRVECISCHDPHNAAGEPYLLAVSNKRSALCLSCHIK